MHPDEPNIQKEKRSFVANLGRSLLASPGDAELKRREQAVKNMAEALKEKGSARATVVQGSARHGGAAPPMPARCPLQRIQAEQQPGTSGAPEFH